MRENENGKKYGNEMQVMEGKNKKSDEPNFLLITNCNLQKPLANLNNCNYICKIINTHIFFSISTLVVGITKS